MTKAYLILLSLVFTSGCIAQEGRIDHSTINENCVILDSILIEKNSMQNMENYHFECYSANYIINEDSSLSLMYLMRDTHIADFNITNNIVKKIPISGKSPFYSSFLSLIKTADGYSILNDASELFFYKKDSINLPSVLLNQQSNFSSQDIYVTADLGFNYRPPFENDSSIIIVVAGSGHKKNTFAGVNLTTKETIFYNFNRRKEYNKYYHPLLNGIKMETVGDTLIVNYQFSEKIDLFSLKNKNYLGSKILKSKYQL